MSGPGTMGVILKGASRKLAYKFVYKEFKNIFITDSALLFTLNFLNFVSRCPCGAEW